MDSPLPKLSKSKDMIQTLSMQWQGPQDTVHETWDGQGRRWLLCLVQLLCLVCFPFHLFSLPPQSNHASPSLMHFQFVFLLAPKEHFWDIHKLAAASQPNRAHMEPSFVTTGFLPMVHCNDSDSQVSMTAQVIHSVHVGGTN